VVTILQASPLVYALLLTFAASISIFTAVLVWRRRRVPGGFAVLIFMGALFVWALTYAIYWVSPTEMRLFWLNVTYFGVVAVPGAFFAFTLIHTGRQHWITGWRGGLLIVQPLLTLLLLWTDPMHGLFYAGKQTPESSVIFDGGPWFWLHIIYSYTLLLISVIFLAQAVVRAHAVFRWQAALVLIAALLPWFSNIISLIGLNPLEGLDLTPLSFSLTGLIIAYSLYRTGLLDLVPVARSQVVDQLSEAVIVVDAQERIVDVNASALQLLRQSDHRSAADLIGLPIQTFFPQWRQWLTEDKFFEYTAVPGLTAETGAVLRGTISALQDGRESAQGKILVLTDVTFEKRLEQELRQSLVYFQAIFDSSTDALFICDAATGAILDANQRAAEIYGYTREEMLGSSEIDQFSAGFEPYTREQALERFRLAREQGSLAFEWMSRTKANTLIWVDMHIRYVRLGDDNRFLIRVSDITERKRAREREFELALERERSTILTQFVRDASHEFLTPLASIQTGLYLLSRTDDPTRRAERTAQIELQVNRIKRLVSTLVTLSQLDSGVTLEHKQVDINALVRRIAAETLGEDSPLRVVYHLDENVGSCRADPAWLREAVNQLIDNAQRFTPEGGTLTIRTERQADRLKIAISDTGIGIAEEDQKRIFDRFFRVDHAHTSPGFGLGLTIASRITELHGGCLEVASEPGRGSTFTIVLPDESAESAAHPSE
jgi:PAS domain S-box-containing protein